jgi:flagellar biogenesis protein FliO
MIDMQSPELLRRAGMRAVGTAVLGFALIAEATAQDAAPALAQGQDIVELPSMGRVIFVFLLVAGLAVGVAYALRRYSPNFARGLVQQGPLRVIDRANLNPGLRVHLVEVDGERLLIAENRTGISMLQLRSPAQSSAKSESA